MGIQNAVLLDCQCLLCTYIDSIHSFMKTTYYSTTITQYSMKASMCFNLYSLLLLANNSLEPL
jgi:hypothetical protein